MPKNADQLVFTTTSHIESLQNKNLCWFSGEKCIYRKALDGNICLPSDRCLDCKRLKENSWTFDAITKIIKADEDEECSAEKVERRAREHAIDEFVDELKDKLTEIMNEKTAGLDEGASNKVADIMAEVLKWARRYKPTASD